MKLLSWLNDDNSHNFLERADDPQSPALKHKLKELAAIPVTKVMIPRPLIAGLDADVQLRRVKRLKSSKVRYFPVYRGDLNRVLGWIEKAKVIDLLNEGADDARLANFVQPVARIREGATANQLADAFVASKSPLVIVVNEQGETAGLVTLMSFVELLFGLSLESAQPTQSPEAPVKPYEL